MLPAIRPCFPRPGASAAAPEQPETTALVARMTAPPTAARREQIDALVRALKDAGVWSKLDGLYVLAAHDAQVARLNWKADAFNLIAVNAPVFTADRGYQGNATSSYLETGFNPTATTGARYGRDSAHLGVWSRTAGTGSGVEIGLVNALLQTRTTSDLSTVRINSTTNSGYSSTSGAGHFVGTRPNAATQVGFENGVQRAGFAVGSAPLDNASLSLMRRSGGLYSARQLAAAHFGGDLTPVEVSALYNALQTWMTAVGP